MVAPLLLLFWLQYFQGWFTGGLWMRRVAGYIVAFRYFALFWCLGRLANISSQLQLRPVPFDSWGGVSCCERKLLFLAMALCPIWPWVTQNCNTFVFTKCLFVLLNIVHWIFYRSEEEPPHDRKLCPTFEIDSILVSTAYDIHGW